MKTCPKCGGTDIQPKYGYCVPCRRKRYMELRRDKGIRSRDFHGMIRTPEYQAYCGAKARCTNPKDVSYSRYGGSGVRFLFRTFKEFWNELGSRPIGHSLDRIDPWGNYEPGNVRWATAIVQANNKRRKTPRYWMKLVSEC